MKYKFKKGQTVHLDDVYEIIGIIPRDVYEQDDPNDRDGDCGESIRFIKGIEINIGIKYV